jgi:putative ABC transport system permease protein
MLRKGLVIFQFSMTLFLLIQTFTAERQLNYMRKINLGVDVERTIVVRTPNGSESKELFKSFKNQLLANSEVQVVTASSSVPGQPSSEMGSTNVGVNLVGSTEETSFNYYTTWIDEDFIPAMHVELLDGENFNAQTRSNDKIIANEEAIKLLGISDVQRAVGRKMTLWGKERTIVGVIKNFHQTSAKDPFIPMLFLHGDERNKLVSVRSQSGNAAEDLSLVKKVYSSIFPDSPFEYFFLDQQFNLQYKSDEQFQHVFGTLSGFAILIACLGLFGLVSFTVSNRTKEIGVRKVLGASVRQIVTLLSRDFIALILVSTVISIVVTYFLIQNWLEKFAFRIDLNVWLFIIPAFGVLVVSVLTIFLKTYHISSANPVDALKEE